MTSSGRRKSPAFENAVLTAGEHHNMKRWALHGHHGLEQPRMASDHGVPPQKQRKTLQVKLGSASLRKLAEYVIKVKLILCIKSVIGRKQSETL